MQWAQWTSPHRVAHPPEDFVSKDALSCDTKNRKPQQVCDRISVALSPGTVSFFSQSMQLFQIFKHTNMRHMPIIMPLIIAISICRFVRLLITILHLSQKQSAFAYGRILRHCQAFVKFFIIFRKSLQNSLTAWRYLLYNTLVAQVSIFLDSSVGRARGC